MFKCLKISHKPCAKNNKITPKEHVSFKPPKKITKTNKISDSLQEQLEILKRTEKKKESNEKTTSIHDFLEGQETPIKLDSTEDFISGEQLFANQGSVQFLIRIDDEELSLGSLDGFEDIKAEQLIFGEL